MMNAIKLPFPARELQPNARVHYLTKSRFTKMARHDAFWATKDSGIKIKGSGEIFITLIFRPPNNRPRDRDNLMAACKAYADGIADALKVNDSRFRFNPVVIEAPEKNGSTFIVVTEQVLEVSEV